MTRRNSRLVETTHKPLPDTCAACGKGIWVKDRGWESMDSFWGRVIGSNVCGPTKPDMQDPSWDGLSPCMRQALRNPRSIAQRVRGMQNLLRPLHPPDTELADS